MAVTDVHVKDVKATDSEINCYMEINGNPYLIVVNYKKNDGTAKTAEGKIDPFAFVLEKPVFMNQDSGQDLLGKREKEFAVNTLLVWAQANLANPICRMLQGLR